MRHRRSRLSALLATGTATLVAGTLALTGSSLPAHGANSDTTSLGPGGSHTGAATHAAKARAATPTRHFITNLNGSRRPFRLGFDVADTGDGRTEINGLPRGVKALVWMGQKCPTQPTADFRRSIRRLATNHRVFGYYLSDEPHIADCPGSVSALRARTDIISRLSHGRQHSFIVLDDRRDYRAFAPRRTGVTLIGIDPYPCSVNNTPRCDLRKIGQRVRQATNAGIPRRKLVPTYQAFGQEKTSDPYYLLPRKGEMARMLKRWHQLLPHPVMDYTYGWGHQSSSNPTLVDSAPLQDLFAAWFAR
ncbi:MAG: hypothetical protein WBV37_06265 [Nocardioidaceae bacterium]